MTLATACTPRVVVTGNGTRGPYSLVDASSVAIRLVSTSHLRLTRYSASTDDNNDGTLLVENTDYTVGGTQDARTFTLASSQAVLTSSQRILAERIQSYTQDLDLTTGGSFNAESVETRFDKHGEFLQELKARVDRCVPLQYADSTSSVGFPSPPTSATQFLARNTAGEFVYATAASLDVDVTLGSGWETVLGLPSAGILDNLSGVRFVSNNAALTALTTATGLSDNALYATLGASTERDGGQAVWIYDSASTATANASILAIDGGGAGRFYKWRATIISMDDFAGDTDTAKLQAAITYAGTLTGGRYIRITRSFTLTTGVTVPQLCILDGCGFTVTKGANIDMFTLADQARLANMNIDGEGATYTGRGVVVSAGNNQRMINVDIIDMNGYNLEFTADLVGSNFAWIGGSFNRTTASNDAIKLYGTAAETSTGGGRRFIGLAGNGSAMIDFSGGNLTYIIGCTAASVTFGDNCANVVIDDSSRIAQHPTIKGSGHKLDAIWTASPTITLASGANSCRLGVQSGATLTDNSGVSTNEVQHWTGRVYTDTSGTQINAQSADNKTLVQYKSGANNRMSIVLDASGNVELATQNSKELQFGIGTADDLIIGATTISSSLDVMPAVTESLDLGSASLEWDNIFLQNAATVSDMRRKIDNGEIDGAQVLAYYERQTPRWFQWKPVVIPAHTKIVNEEYEEDETDPRTGEVRTVQKVRKVPIEIPEHVIQHGRRHAGRFAQEVKEAIDSSGIGDFGGYAYEEESDTHVLRPLEDIALLIAAVKHLSRRVAELEGGKPPAPSSDPIPNLEAIREKLEKGAKDNGGSEGMEYGVPEVITEVEPEPASDHRPRLIASDWLKSQMRPGESLAQARNRLLAEFNDLLNKNVTASFANDDERIRFRDLTANMTDFSKG